MKNYDQIWPKFGLPSTVVIGHSRPETIQGNACGNTDQEQPDTWI